MSAVAYAVLAFVLVGLTCLIRWSRWFWFLPVALGLCGWVSIEQDAEARRAKVEQAYQEGLIIYDRRKALEKIRRDRTPEIQELMQGYDEP